MGNGGSIDLGSARKLNRAAFVPAISEFSAKYSAVDGLFAKAEPHELFTSPGIHVAVRKRPIWRREKERGEFDVVSVGGDLGGQRDTMWIHDARLRLDARHMYIDHHGFPFDAVFDETATSEEVYRRAVAPLVSTSLAPGGRAAVIAFGQTGTGKTFTMARLSELAAADLFQSLPATTSRVTLTAIEIYGNTVRNLLAEEEGSDAATVQLREDASGTLALVGAAPAHVRTADELCALLTAAYASRATSATGVNDTSSRSHAIYRISLWEGEGAGGEEESVVGMLTLVDLAGSEWSRDQHSHSREQQAEARGINASLMTLKQCIRARVSADRIAKEEAGKQPKTTRRRKEKAPRMPIRESKLTRVLHDCFTNPVSRTLVVACVSPASGDVEHTMESLRGGQGSVKTSSGWGMPAETLLSSNVPGVAVLSPGDAAAAAAGGAGNSAQLEKLTGLRESGVISEVEFAAAKEKLMSDASRPTRVGDSENPREWTPSQCCEWWTAAAESAFLAAVDAAKLGPRTFSIEVRASSARFR